MISSLIVTALLWTAALSSCLIARIYFAFSVFIMQAFRKIETSQSVATINTCLIKPLSQPNKKGDPWVENLVC